MFAAAMGRAQAQQTGKVYRIAFANLVIPVADQNQASKGSLITPVIFEELIRLGYVEGRNLLIERYSGEGRPAHYPDLARQIVSRNPDLIIARFLARSGGSPRCSDTSAVGAHRGPPLFGRWRVRKYGPHSDLPRPTVKHIDTCPMALHLNGVAIIRLSGDDKTSGRNRGIGPDL